ncbi:hypothetical protein LUZ60_001008 [Juncus effusus]|nr:hypothetical protein LUZ60_001008 [Juncus effusus]
MASGDGISELEAGRLLSRSPPNGHSPSNKPLNRHGRTAHSISASSLRKKSEISVTIVSKVPCYGLRSVLANLQEIFLNTKLSILFFSVIMAFIAYFMKFHEGWIFLYSLIGLVPLAERVSFLTEQLAYYTGPTLGGLLNATCGNATELIIALFALNKGQIEVVKCSLLGSILSNLLLVLGTSLFCGGIKNLSRDQKYDRKQADVSMSLLFLGVLCHILPLMYAYAAGTSATQNEIFPSSKLDLSRVSSIAMLLAYGVYLFFQLKTNTQLFDEQELQGLVDDDDAIAEEEAVIGWKSAIGWLVAMTIIIAILSEYIVNTIEDASQSWGLSVSFISIILLPIVGNAAEHAGAVLFAMKNKLDITLGVSLGSATQISMFVVPLTVIVAWITGINMDLDFKLLETGALFMSILVTAFTLQDGTSHYLKGAVLLLCYLVIAVCFLAVKSPTNLINETELGVIASNTRTDA